MIQIHPSQESFILTIRLQKALKYRRRFRNCTTWTKILKVQVCIHRWQIYDTYEGHKRFISGTILKTTTKMVTVAWVPSPVNAAFHDIMLIFLKFTYYEASLWPFVMLLSDYFQYNKRHKLINGIMESQWSPRRALLKGVLFKGLTRKTWDYGIYV